MLPDGARQFDIQRCLGSGGFGEVYEARMTSAGGLRTSVAVKVLRSEVALTSDAVVRLRDEGRALAALDHPAIVRAHDLTVLDGRIALVTELVDGADLVDCIGSSPDPLGPRALLQVIGPIADALSAAWHAEGPQGRLYLVHRDIKPSNLRIGRHGQVKLLDFGIARFEGEREARTTSDVVMGSLPFMAPERFVDRRSRSASDVFSLGCCLYQGLSGAPFLVDPRLTVLSTLALDRAAFDAARADRLRALSSLPDTIQALVADMVAFDPAERPSAADVARRCEELADELSGPTLRRWCTERSWPEPPEAPPSPGSLAGTTLTEGTLPTAAPPPRVASDAAPPRMMTEARGTLDPSTDLPGLAAAKEAMAERRVDTPVAPPAFPSIPLGMAVKKGDQITIEELEESLGKDAAGALTAAKRPVTPATADTIPATPAPVPKGISQPLPPQEEPGGSRTLLLAVVALMGLGGIAAAVVIVLAALGILALSL